MALGATAGVVRFLEEHGVGYDWGVPNVRVPIVIGAAIDDPDRDAATVVATIAFLAFVGLACWLVGRISLSDTAAPMISPVVRQRRVMAR